METKYTIYRGPGEFDLSLALLRGTPFLQGKKAGEIPVNAIDFKVYDSVSDTRCQEGFHIYCTVDSIVKTNCPQGPSIIALIEWTISGIAVLEESRDKKQKQYSYTAKFSTHTRKGTITLTPLK